MGKRNKKRRKQQLSRPPKRGKQPQAVMPHFPDIEDAEGASIGAPAAYFDAPAASALSPREERPFGAVDPSMYQSTRYKKFRDTVESLRASLPDSVEQFATYDLPELQDRTWLTRYCIKKEAGKLPGWQQLILEKAGFNWVRGRPPRPKSAVKKNKSKWAQAYEALIAACSADTTPMLGLLRCDEAHYKWLRRQISAIQAGKLSQAHREKLQALPFDFEAVCQDAGFGHWRTRFKAYAAGQMPTAQRWAAHQAHARSQGDLPQWRIDALNALDFDWAVKAPASSANKQDAQKKKEARWRAKLDRYCELQAAHGPEAPFPVRVDGTIRPWVSRMRAMYKKGELRPEMVKEFKAKGFEFDGKAAHKREWQGCYRKLCAFKEKFGHVQVPSSYCEDPALGKWFAIQQERMRKGILLPKKLAQLKALGVPARNASAGAKVPQSHISPWLKRFSEIQAILVAEHGGRLPVVGRFSERHRAWMKRQAKKMKSDMLEPWHIEKLESIGFDPQHLPEPPPQVNWGDRLERLRRFIQEHGHAQVPRGYADRKLGAFVEGIRGRKRKGRLNERELQDLREVGFVFSPNREVTPAWMREYAALKKFHQQHGHSNVPRAFPDNQPLAEFVAQQRQRGRKGKLLAEHIQLLDALDFRWVGAAQPVPKR
jgi:hypothetical protein